MEKKILSNKKNSSGEKKFLQHIDCDNVHVSCDIERIVSDDNHEQELTRHKKIELWKLF